MIGSFLKKALSRAGVQVSRIDKRTDVDHYLRLYGAEAVKNKIFYNVGAGSFYHPCWTNIDSQSEWYVKFNKGDAPLVNYDLFSIEPIEVNSDTAQLIYTSHTIEHVTDMAVQNLFNEAHRMLKKGGLLRIVTPNIDIEYHAWRQNDRDYWHWKDDFSSPEAVARVNLRMPLNDASTAQLFLEGFVSTASTIVNKGSENRITDEELEKIFHEKSYTDALNFCVSRGSVEIQKKFPFHHINWFNKEKLFRMLKQAGFEEIHLSAYGQSFAPVLRNLKYFDATLPKVSMYVEAIK